MKATIIVTDIYIRFRLLAIAGPDDAPQTWQMEVMTIQQVTQVLIAVGLLNVDCAQLLCRASTTITPQPGVTTVPFGDITALTEIVYPLDEPPTPEVLEGYILIAKGETTDQALAVAGFSLKINRALQ